MALPAAAAAAAAAGFLAGVGSPAALAIAIAAQAAAIWGDEGEDEKLAIVEVRAAAGGEEAEIWASDLYKVNPKP